MYIPGEQAGGVPVNAVEALAMTGAGLDYLNSSAAAAELDPAALGGVLTALGELQAKLTAAHAEALRRFDAADAHDADGYGSSGRWLAAMAGMTRKGAKAAMAEMRRLREHADIAAALAAGTITRSLGFEAIDWTNRLPAELRRQADQILLAAAAGGADADDLKLIAAAAYERWRAGQPDGDDDERRFRDRYLQLGITLGGAACLRGALTPECAAALRAVLDGLGKKAGPEDIRTQQQRDHDAVQAGCELLLRADLVPDRAGADTQAEVHIPLSQLRQMPGAPELEDAWLRARAGQDGYLAGDDARAAACDALTVPVVTGHPDMAVIDQIIAIIAAAAGARRQRAGRPGRRRAARDGGPAGHRLRLRPRRDRRRAAHRAAAPALQHPVAAAGHRLVRVHPRRHPPRGPAPGPALRLAPLPPPGGLVRRAPHHP